MTNITSIAVSGKYIPKINPAPITFPKEPKTPINGERAKMIRKPTRQDTKVIKITAKWKITAAEYGFLIGRFLNIGLSSNDSH